MDKVEEKMWSSRRARRGNCAAVAVHEGKFGGVAFPAAAAVPVMFGVALVAMLLRVDELAAMPLLFGGVWDVAVAIWNDFWDEHEEVAWLTAEVEVIERLVDRFEGFAGVWLEDGNGDEIDVDNLAHPNAPDGGMDVIIVVDEGSYTERGFQRTCTRVLNIISRGDY